VRHYIVHQVLADRLRSLVEKVTLLLPDLFKPRSFFGFTNAASFCFFSLDPLALFSFSLGTQVFLFFTANERANFVLLIGLGVLLPGLTSTLLRGQVIELFTFGLLSQIFFANFLSQLVLGLFFFL